MQDDDFTGQSSGAREGGQGEGESLKARLARERAEAKKVNACMSALAKREKQSAQRRRAGAGLSEALLKEVVAMYRGDIKRQVNHFMRMSSMPAATGRARQVSDKTRSDFGDNLMRAVTQLREIKMPIQNLSDLSGKHTVALISYWKHEDQAAATIQTKLSALRKFFTLVGKEDALPKAVKLYDMLAQKGIDHGGLRRTQVATTSKSWSMKGVDPLQVVKDVYAEDPLVGLQLKSEVLFGMRLNEVLHWQPIATDDPRRLLILDGAKGGRVRYVEYSSDPVRAALQRQLVEEAKIAAQMHPRGVLLRKRQSVQQAKDRFYTVMRKVGVTKACWPSWGLPATACVTSLQPTCTRRSPAYVHLLKAFTPSRSMKTAWAQWSKPSWPFPGRWAMHVLPSPVPTTARASRSQAAR